MTSTKWHEFNDMEYLVKEIHKNMSWKDCWIYDGSLYFTICPKISTSIFFGFFVLMICMFFSQQLLEICLINWSNCQRSYIINEYGIYNVNDENNEFIRNFKYLCIDILPS
jgi:hypothetical protein